MIVTSRSSNITFPYKRYSMIVTSRSSNIDFDVIIMCVLVNMCACVVCVKWTSLITKRNKSYVWICVCVVWCTWSLNVNKPVRSFCCCCCCCCCLSLFQFVFLRYTFFLQEWWTNRCGRYIVVVVVVGHKMIVIFANIKKGSDKLVIQFGNGRISLLFSLAKMIFNSAYGLVEYHLSRLNKRDIRPSPHRITVYYSN